MTSTGGPRTPRSVREWRLALGILASGVLLFETVSGLGIQWLPFGVGNQVNVLVHTGIGLLFLVPLAWYQLRHWRLYRARPTSHVSVTGYVGAIATLVAVVSGLVLTAQALWGTRIGQAWDTAHTVTAYAIPLAVLPHVLALRSRVSRASSVAAMRAIARAADRHLAGVVTVCVGLIVAVLLGARFAPAIEWTNELPADYVYLYGEDRPFAPSLAKTVTGGALDARTLAGSKGCGTAGCHQAIYDEWQVSAHRYAAMDTAFQKVQAVMAEQNGPETTRYCGGCHDPISLFSGNKNLYEDELTNAAGYQEGISCVACHAITETDVKGNAAYVMSQPDRYLFELHEGPVARTLGDFLIRAYPRHHVESLQHTMFKTPEFCAACHKQFIDEEINQVGWVQLQNQFDNWRKSRWNEPGDPEETIECRECHMPLIDSEDPAAGDAQDYNRTPADGKHRSHRFLAANQFMPAALDLPGAAEHVELTEKWLRGELEIPEIDHKWKAGPAVPVELRAPKSVQAGEEVQLHAVITNNKVGHDFPTGPLDIIQAWVEIEVTDQAGNVVFTSGKRTDDHFIEPGAFLFKAEPVDQFGQLIDRHNLWEMVGVRYRRALFPGFSDQASYGFSCPGSFEAEEAVDALAEGDSERSLDRQAAFVAPGEVTELRVTAKLLYRKVDQFLLNFLFGADSGLTAPITSLSEDTAVIAVRPG